MDEGDFKARLVRFYTAYNPEKVDEISSVLEKYKGKESQLMEALVRKYGPEPSEDGAAAAPVANNPTPSMSPLEERLHAFYTKYNPEKLGDVKSTLEKYKGKEAALFEALVRKYGPEPGESSENEEDDDDDDDLSSTAPSLKPMVYCPIDTLPPEYCEYGPCFEECKPWLLENCPDLMIQKYQRTVKDLMDVEAQIASGVTGLTLQDVSGVADKKNKRKIGIKDASKVPQTKADAKVYIEKIRRTKRKSVTLLVGLEFFPKVDKLKDAAKKLGKKFACSAAVNKLDTGTNQIQLQGDCQMDLPEVLIDMFDIPEEAIWFLEKGKAEPAF